MRLGKKVEIFVLQQEILHLEREIEKVIQIKEKVKRDLFSLTHESLGIEEIYTSLKNRISSLQKKLEEKKDKLFLLSNNLTPYV